MKDSSIKGDSLLHKELKLALHKNEELKDLWAKDVALARLKNEALVSECEKKAAVTTNTVSKLHTKVSQLTKDCNGALATTQRLTVENSRLQRERDILSEKYEQEVLAHRHFRAEVSHATDTNSLLKQQIIQLKRIITNERKAHRSDIEFLEEEYADITASKLYTELIGIGRVPKSVREELRRHIPQSRAQLRESLAARQRYRIEHDQSYEALNESEIFLNSGKKKKKIHSKQNNGEKSNRNSSSIENNMFANELMELRNRALNLQQQMERGVKTLNGNLNNHTTKNKKYPELVENRNFIQKHKRLFGSLSSSSSSLSGNES